ncbi:MAG: AraC family transcriptional regulator [Alphaproteobacteria bacterium]|nr:AraC family transcriptional regulator [Alphaproteobacteria bacterium]
MSRKRQPLAPSQQIRPEWPARPVVAFSRDLLDGDVIARHRHDHAQFLYATAGVMRVQTPIGTWVVPPHRAVWIPSGIEHEVGCVGDVEMRTVYIHSEAAPIEDSNCSVLSVSPLLRELVLAAIGLPPDHAAGGPEARQVAVLLDQIAAAPLIALHLPIPKDKRLRYVTESLAAAPADNRTLEAWSVSAGASARTLARLFLAETGLSFRAWRRQVRVHEALARLATGEPVTSVAFSVGYDSPSAFIAMFREVTGETPGRYFERATDGERA